MPTPSHSGDDGQTASADILPWDYPVPPLLYKYLRPERLDVLTSCSVVFSHRKAFTDSRELSPEFACLGTEQEILDFTTLKEINLADLIRHIPVPWRIRDLAPFTLRNPPPSSPRDIVWLIARDHDSQKKAIESAKKAMESPNLFGIFCLTEAGDCERMWTDYADQGRGFAVAFDTTCVGFNQLKTPGRFGKVTYSDEPVGSFLSLAQSGDIGGAVVFFRKRMSYSFEREWRSVRAFRRLTKGPEGRFFGKFSPECVRKILIRPTCTVQTELRELIQRDRYRHIEILEVGRGALEK